MSEQGFHEIQLSGKQLVFLFMSLLVLAVVVFLLGVSVGRGVRLGMPSPPAMAEASVPGDTSVPASMPPATQTTPNELDYHERLQGRGGTDPTKVAEPPPPPADAPASSPSAPPAGTSQQAGSKMPAPAGRTGADATRSAGAPTPAANAAKPASGPAAAAPPPATGGWSVQVNAFRSKELADGLVAKLKGKGYTAFIFNVPAPGIPYHVRVGPFAQRDEAVQAMDRLKKEKEGYTPSVIR